MPIESAEADAQSVETQIEDTRVHAIDPFVGDYARASGKDGRLESAANGHALDEKEDGIAKADDASPEPDPSAALQRASPKSVTFTTRG